MTIIKKDGNVYTLEGPNKLAKNQENWNIKKLIFHNFSWQEIVYKKNQEYKIKPKIEIKNDIVLEEKPLELESPKIEELEKQVEIKAEPAEPDKKFEDPTFELPFIKHKVLMHCLPAKIKKGIDPLYGETWINVQYQKKFIFPCVLISSQDLVMEFWTSDPHEQITEKSIIYPFLYEIYNEQSGNYDRVPFDDRRWWKVIEKEKKEMGWLFKTMPSETHPDFSE